MSMLAEPRRKQKWALNPRGKQWSEDPNKFGQKMLEKMGWSNGKGLGANEQGMTEHVRVSLKNDMGGIGFNNDDLDKAWTEHQDSFNDFLQKLQHDTNGTAEQVEESKTELSGTSLELKSKQSRARVHYQKFTRGKDVNRYSSKDLANIFGQKELNLSKDAKNMQTTNEERSEPIGSQDNRGGVITINGGNMADYFMKKGQDISIVSIEKRRRNDSESEPEYVGFGFASTSDKTKSSDNVDSKKSHTACTYAFENPCVQLNSPEHSLNTSNKYLNSFVTAKKRKSSDDNELKLTDRTKKFKDNKTTENVYIGIVNAGLNLECQPEEACNGKDFEVSRAQFGLTNTALDLSDEAEDKKRVRFNDYVEYSTDSAKKRKGRSMLDKFEVENKKAKKKRKNNGNDNDNNSVSSGFINKALDIEETPEEVHDNELNERKSKKSKKRKGSRRSNLETITEMPEEDKETSEKELDCNQTKTENIPNEDVSGKKKKRKKHKDKGEEVVEIKHNVGEITESDVLSEVDALGKEGCEIQEDDENTSKKKKKKKKRKDKDIELDFEKDTNVVSEVNSDVRNTEGAEQEIVEAETLKMKKKKKKSKKDDTDDTNNTEINMKNEKEISDKENTSNLQETETKKLKKRKNRKSIDESENTSFTYNAESMGESIQETNKVECNTLSETSSNERCNNTSSPWNRTAKMPKRLLKSLFQRNFIPHFPGSNIHEIKGYGADV